MNRLLVAILASLVLVSVAEARQQPAPQTQTQQAPRNIIADVRGLIAKDDFDAAEKTLRQFITEKGHTPDALEALSWLGRGALAKKRFDAAYSYASETYGLSVDALKNRKLDAEPRLPIALGAAIEVQAHVMAQRGQRSEAIYFLQRELEDYQATSIRTRLQKNIHLLSLEGKPAPAYETNEYVGSKPAGIEELRGKPVLLFFWAHWCPDCKAMAPVLAELQAAYKDKGLVVVAPTQRYGYVAKRAPADAKTEMDYIGHVAREFYAAVDWTVPVSADSFANYGSSTTPTVVLVDRQGIVRLYHPGQMTKAELEPHLRALVDARATNPH